MPLFLTREQARRLGIGKPAETTAPRKRKPEAQHPLPPPIISIGSVEVVLPIRIESELNRRGDWQRHERFSEQKRAAYYTLQQHAITLQLIAKSAGIRVTMTRLGRRFLDDDNLAGGFKAVRDQVAALLKIDDADPRVRWRCEQELADHYAARVVIEAVETNKERQREDFAK